MRKDAGPALEPAPPPAWNTSPGFSTAYPQPGAAMRALSLLSLVVLASAAPAAGQGILLPVGCARECQGGALSIDSVAAWADLQRGYASTFVRYVFRNDGKAPLDGAFFFPLPADATVSWTTVYANGAVEMHGEWDEPGEARRILDSLASRLSGGAWREEAGRPMMHVRIPAIPAHGVKRLQIHYVQPLRTEGASIRYAYPLATRDSGAHLTLGMTIRTEAGFDDLRSPSHAVDVEWGTESARCPPQMRCGYRGVPSHRV
jgi:hypothetical protein